MRLLPFDYAARNLGRSPLRLAISVLGSMLVVVLAISAFAFVRGMDRSLSDSGSERNVILMGAGSEESIERSEVSASVAGQVQASVFGIKSEAGQAFVSPEVHAALGVALEPETEPVGQAVFRGVVPAAFQVHPQVRLIEGRTFNTGADEIIVGELAATRLGVPAERLAVGEVLYMDDRPFTIVGRFAAPNTVMNAEVWVPLTNLQILTRRDGVSCVVLTLDQGEFADVDVFVKSRVDLELAAVTEAQYYRQLSNFYKPVKMMIWVTAILIGVGGLLGGLNTMYAAFASRIREVGTLQSLGYPRRAVMLSFVQESMLAAAAGAVLGALLSLLLLDGVSIRFSMGAFGLLLDGPTIGFGIAAGLLLGLFGSIPPALRCLRMPIAESLKAA
ncbi:MAG: ABC transporter permease [Phycisphaerales bacterium JB063]